MSVDDRLREAFRETDRSWDGAVPRRWPLSPHGSAARTSPVVRRSPRPPRPPRPIAAVVLIVTNPGDHDQVPAPEPTTPTPTSAAANPLDGFWVSDVLTRADVRRAARLAGDASDAEAMLDGLPVVPFRFTMTIDGDRNELISHVRSGDQESLMDQENVELRGRTAGADPAVRRRCDHPRLDPRRRHAAHDVRVDDRGSGRRRAGRGVAAAALRRRVVHPGRVSSPARAHPSSGTSSSARVSAIERMPASPGCAWSGPR